MCGFHEYEPTEEDIEELEEFWWECDTDMDGELSMEEALDWAEANGY